MSVLLTGGAGFIGAEVIRLLLEHGEEDIFVFSRSPNLQRLDELADKVQLLRGDVGIYSHVLNAVKAAKPDTIYHLGAMLSVPSDADPASSFQTNAAGTFHVLEAARLFDVRQVIFASSIGVYGQGIDADEIDDVTIQRPNLFYGATKSFGENLGHFFKRKYGLDFRGVRYPSIVGPGVRSPGVVQFTSWMIEESALGRPFTVTVSPEIQIPILYVKEAARGTVDLAHAPLENIVTGMYNIDGPHPTPSAGDIAAAVKAQLPDSRITFDPDPELEALRSGIKQIIDDRARTEWGWNPQYKIDRMVSELIAELKANPHRYT
jgi:threonine 3-dehydrogenase